MLLNVKDRGICMSLFVTTIRKKEKMVITNTVFTVIQNHWHMKFNTTTHTSGSSKTISTSICQTPYGQNSRTTPTNQSRTTTTATSRATRVPSREPRFPRAQVPGAQVPRRQPLRRRVQWGSWHQRGSRCSTVGSSARGSV